jgi:hypothetical protein
MNELFLRGLDSSFTHLLLLRGARAGHVDASPLRPFSVFMFVRLPPTFAGSLFVFVFVFPKQI